MKKKVSKKQMIKLYEKMGLIDVTTDRQEENGTLSFYDEVSQSNYVFRKFSPPRIEYISEKTNTLQSYALTKNYEGSVFEPQDIADDMLNCLPKIVNRKVKSAYKRSLIAMDISKNIVNSFM